MVYEVTPSVTSYFTWDPYDGIFVPKTAKICKNKK